MYPIFATSITSPSDKTPRNFIALTLFPLARYFPIPLKSSLPKSGESLSIARMKSSSKARLASK
jgi:hypothetical protein